MKFSDIADIAILLCSLFRSSLLVYLSLFTVYMP